MLVPRERAVDGVTARTETPSCPPAILSGWRPKEFMMQKRWALSLPFEGFPLSEHGAMLREADFIRFEEVIDDFRSRFTDQWLYA